MLKNAAPRPDSSSTRMNSADAFATACCGIRRFMICTLVLPRAVDHAASRITPTVTVFTPPAVEPDEPQGRNLRLAVTDSTLLAQTGGIVQGMSGSPILQDGRLIGAVTHVLLSDPAKGYGVSIDDMLAAAQAA